ncbi:hypothetical protein MRB53_042278 [Persea americana]|nr:hypothetical protein MRB53_042278 [Persea americana]
MHHMPRSTCMAFLTTTTSGCRMAIHRQADDPVAFCRPFVSASLVMPIHILTTRGLSDPSIILRCTSFMIYAGSWHCRDSPQSSLPTSCLFLNTDGVA